MFLRIYWKIGSFVIKKWLDFVCKKTELGKTLLIKTKNFFQAQKLLKIQTFHDFPVRAEEHQNLNTYKEVI